MKSNQWRAGTDVTAYVRHNIFRGLVSSVGVYDSTDGYAVIVKTSLAKREQIQPAAAVVGNQGNRLDS